jgi:hypothetical protein
LKILKIETLFFPHHPVIRRRACHWFIQGHSYVPGSFRRIYNSVQFL